LPGGSRLRGPIWLPSSSARSPPRKPVYAAAARTGRRRSFDAPPRLGRYRGQRWTAAASRLRILLDNSAKFGPPEGAVQCGWSGRRVHTRSATTGPDISPRRTFRSSSTASVPAALSAPPSAPGLRPRPRRPFRPKIVVLRTCPDGRREFCPGGGSLMRLTFPVQAPRPDYPAGAGETAAELSRVFVKKDPDDLGMRRDTVRAPVEELHARAFPIPRNPKAGCRPRNAPATSSWSGSRVCVHSVPSLTFPAARRARRPAWSIAQRSMPLSPGV